MKILTCKRCGGPLGASNKSGFCSSRPACKREGNRIAARKWVKNNRDTQEAWKEANPFRVLLIKIRSRAQRAGVPFELEVCDIPDIPTNCPCCSVELKRSDFKARNQSPSIDRIVPAQGYVKGNIQWLCFRCNSLKRDATPEELMQLALFMNRRAA
jgi:hypothetical protein